MLNSPKGQTGMLCPSCVPNRGIIYELATSLVPGNTTQGPCFDLGEDAWERMVQLGTLLILMAIASACRGDKVFPWLSSDP